LSPEAFLQRLQTAPDYEDQIVHVRRFPPRPPRFSEPERPLPPPLAAALRAAGVPRLYAHQAAALDAYRAGEHLVVTTATASGKSLCYQLPIAEALIERPEARALLLFPTKALARDQHARLMASGLGEVLRPAVYDGDTPRAERRAIRETARVVLTNPDMLHASILPRHAEWRVLLSNLAAIVLDELHVYRGVFGSHVAGILRRLRRLCEHVGSDPRFIAASATLLNAEELFRGLTGLPARPIDDDGGPQGERIFALWNPPLLEPQSGERRSANREAAGLLAQLARADLRGLVFTRARVVAELVVRYAREILAEEPELAEALAAYRAGYTAAERREIERRLFAGELAGVATTSALELGIDVGVLDVVTLVGYPGTVVAARQQAGRAGRSGRPALAVLIAGSGPLDQFLMRRPEFLFDAAPERAALNPENPYILLRHLLCAAWERPLTADDVQLFGPEFDEIASVLAGAGHLVRRGAAWHSLAAESPAPAVGIRCAGGSPFTIVDGDGHLLGVIDAETAMQTVHPGAIYLHQGESYRVIHLDLVARQATVQAVVVEFYTVPRTQATVRVEERHDACPAGVARAGVGEVTVTTRVTGYRRQRLLSETLLEVVPLDLPEQSYRTEAVWIELLTSAGETLPAPDSGALHALEHALCAVAPLLAMCDRMDIGGVYHLDHPDLEGPGLFLYDAHPGGAGVATALYETLDQLFLQTLDLLTSCRCTDGCPGCIHSPRCSTNNVPLDRNGAIRLLERLAPGSRTPDKTHETSWRDSESLSTESRPSSSPDEQPGAPASGRSAAGRAPTRRGS
jgi:DEAD/DEAH box helicase domain-containing protein